MTDPLTIGLGLGALVGGGTGFLFNSGSQSKEVSGPLPGTTNTPPPDPSTPAIAPGSKPAKKSQQQSFLSGAAALQGAGGAGGGMNTGPSGGKTLLGQ